MCAHNDAPVAGKRLHCDSMKGFELEILLLLSIQALWSIVCNIYIDSFLHLV